VSNSEITHVKLVLADRGAFHEIVVDIPIEILARYSRLIDALREDPEITATTYIDFRRLVAARRVDEQGASSDD
jgi:hypothetical protein